MSFIINQQLEAARIRTVIAPKNMAVVSFFLQIAYHIQLYMEYLSQEKAIHCVNDNFISINYYF
ncbi:TPA: hypothetical protein TU158_000754 [Streptococcus equi subsp. zooepidemicus]|uniref:hypothetical protein n=1 Tax=Streptococcus equi TaxID=1336 RepID=UPI001E285A8A|nr:hypothetical protein [Streptococcus equi]MCD3462120.1 hypothetical protein [Streptococcus equi subsp. zooepidemicus]HEK9980290.1 hypothetical protein [Streptococcus equi subsp. zooepidemicus]HEL0766766.1 hypothetical protein [Streptococcus equi subsp. zooepidemicus]HEL0788875.1 hypothetical protein [Streptococcus equi subsp. zooepidemicus]HEL1131038.1 hypothetical protein [Streptococcus equi subsp. zooepidemicus]